MRCPWPKSPSTIACAVPSSAALHKTPLAWNGTHSFALCRTHPCRQCPCRAAQRQASLQPSHHPALCLSAVHTDPAPPRPCLLPSPFIQRQNPIEQISGKQVSTFLPTLPSRRGHPAHGSAVWGIDLSLPCPLRIRSKIAYTSLWVIPRSCLPRLGPLPCGLALGTCTAEIGALQRLSLDLDRSQHFLCLWKDSCKVDTVCSISLIPLLQYCHILLLQGNVHDL